MNIRELIENKSTLDYQQICSSLIQIFRVDERVNWESVLPAQQQQEYFGGETLRLIAEHPILSKQKDIRPIALKRGSISQMLFFFVCLQDSSLPKKQIQDITKKFISGGEASRYIIWFFGNKEHTALKVVLSAREGKKVVLKTLPFAVKQPYFKTYTFILNEVNQRVNQLFIEPTDLWKALWKAFDISVINRNFYDEIKNAFDDLLDELRKRGNPFVDEEERVQFAIRLIGRIIFCWFLKRKNVLHDEAISADAVRSLAQKNYYHDLLEPLFFDVLNTPQGKERKAGLPSIIAGYPFLNGGLFEDQKTDYKNNILLGISNDWFLRLFSKTLERYNFTVDENSSSNAEIAIDPEMLGRIFENLLAEQNPETGESARKSTGSFYTPREIVDYMVEQSITEFLKSSLKSEDQISDLIEDFVHTQVLPNDLSKHSEKLAKALSNVKVLDPACGSGAFPIGILQKIVALKQQLTPKAKNYKLKLDTIQNSIYGSDIQPMAVELSRLRCWLSLVVDEDPKDIKALPNLEFKFVCADSLGELVGLRQVTLGTVTETIEEMRDIRAHFFTASGKEKRKLESDFEKLQRSLFKNITQWAGKSSGVNMLAAWRPFENHKTEWFDKFWMFGLKEGFDIVIGNPPYVLLQNLQITKEKVDHIKKSFFSAQYKIDLYHIFIEQAIKLSVPKGIVCFITPNAFLKNKFNNKLREYIISNTRILKLVRFFVPVFNQASVDNAIFLFQEDTSKNKHNNIQIVDITNENFFEDLVNPTVISQQSILEPAYSFDIESNSENSQLIEHIGSHKKLKEYGRAYFGIQTFNREEFVKSHKLNAEYKPVVDGTNVLRYSLLNPTEWVEFKQSSIKSGGNPEVYAKERILVRQIGKFPEGAYCEPGIYTLNTIYNLFVYEGSKVSLKYILAIINSKLIKFYWLNKFYDSKETFPKIKKAPLESIPIPEIEEVKQKPFITLVDYILELKKSKQHLHEEASNNLILKDFDDILDGMVLEIFFEDEFRKKNLHIIHLVENALRKSENKDSSAKVFNFFKLISHPDNEIRNQVLSLPLVSPDVLKPILQA